MRLKSLALATALTAALATAAGSAFAWHGGERPNPEQRAAHLQKALQLSDDQRKQVQQVLEKSAQQRSALEQKYTIAERDKFRDEMRKLHETQRGQIDALLTPAQREAHAAQRSHMGHHKGMGKRMGDCPPAAAASH